MLKDVWDIPGMLVWFQPLINFFQSNEKTPEGDTTMGLTNFMQTCNTFITEKQMQSVSYFKSYSPHSLSTKTIANTPAVLPCRKGRFLFTLFYGEKTHCLEK